MAQRGKRLPTMRETQVQSLGREDPLEKEMATHSSTLAWKTPWTEKPGRLQSVGSQSWTRLSDFTFTFVSFLCLEVSLQLLTPGISRSHHVAPSGSRAELRWRG